MIKQIIYHKFFVINFVDLRDRMGAKISVYLRIGKLCHFVIAELDSYNEPIVHTKFV